MNILLACCTDCEITLYITLAICLTIIVLAVCICVILCKKYNSEKELRLQEELFKSIQRIRSDTIKRNELVTCEIDLNKKKKTYKIEHKLDDEVITGEEEK